MVQYECVRRALQYDSIITSAFGLRLSMGQGAERVGVEIKDFGSYLAPEVGEISPLQSQLGQFLHVSQRMHISGDDGEAAAKCMCGISRLLQESEFVKRVGV